MAIHIDYDREENKIELILDSQGNVISTLVERARLFIELDLDSSKFSREVYI